MQDTARSAHALQIQPHGVARLPWRKLVHLSGGLLGRGGDDVDTIQADDCAVSDAVEIWPARDFADIADGRMRAFAVDRVVSEDRRAELMSDVPVGRVNAQWWKGYAPGTLLCQSMSMQSTDGGCVARFTFLPIGAAQRRELAL